MSKIEAHKVRYPFLLAVSVSLLLGAWLMTACTSLPAGAPAAARTAVATKAAEPTKAASTSVGQAVTKTTEMTTSTAMTTSSAMTTSAAAGAAVSMLKLYKDAKLGDILVDDQGMVIYVFDKDAKDKSNCTGDCLKNWPAVTVQDEAAKPAAGEGVTAELGVIQRDDGAYQVTINGMPVYHYIKDTKADESNGQGVGNVWWVIAANGDKVTAQ